MTMRVKGLSLPMLAPTLQGHKKGWEQSWFLGGSGNGRHCVGRLESLRVSTIFLILYAGKFRKAVSPNRLVHSCVCTLHMPLLLSSKNCVPRMLIVLDVA